jgi:DNA-binding GntR family transcriptional regulator
MQMNTIKVAKLEARTLKANVTDVLRQLIIDGTLAPGAEFNQIAEQLGVSRGPIREALGQLEQEGLVQSTPYKGVIVTPLTRKYIEELYSVRIALETVALDRFIDRMEDEDLAHLDGIIDQMRTAALSNELTSLSDLDLHFHESLMERADHELAWKMWKVLEVGIRRCLHTRHKTYTFLDEVVGSHPTLVTAIISRNKAEARQILSDHIQESMTGLLVDWEEDEEKALSA